MGTYKLFKSKKLAAKAALKSGLHKGEFRVYVWGEKVAGNRYYIRWGALS